MFVKSFLESTHRFAGFDEGSPDGHDPLLLARLMASRGITLVGCLSYFAHKFDLIGS